MDKKTDPHSIRFDASVELKIQQICLAENQEFAVVLRDLVDNGIILYDLVKKKFTISPRYHDQ
jgi:hypothetical protein